MVLRRFVETVPAALPLLFVVLFIPIALGMRHVFLWVAPPEAARAGMAHPIEQKHPYLNVAFFLARAAIYFAVWIVVAHLLRAWSVRQDTAGGLGTLTAGSGGSARARCRSSRSRSRFAAFDWMMSLDPRFFSTIFGVYWFAGELHGGVRGRHHRRHARPAATRPPSATT